MIAFFDGVFQTATVAVFVLDQHVVVLDPRREIPEDVRIGRDDGMCVDLSEKFLIDTRSPINECNLDPKT